MVRALLLIAFLAGAGRVLAQPAYVDQRDLERIRKLRLVDHDIPAARALAQTVLDRRSARDLLRQEVHYELALTYWDEQDRMQCAQVCRQIVQDYADSSLDPRSEEFKVDNALYLIGVVEHHVGDRILAIDTYEQLVDEFPGSDRRARALMSLGSIHEEDARDDEALSRFRQLVREYPDAEQAPEAQLHVGHLLMRNQRYGEAAIAFEDVDVRWPRSSLCDVALQNANRAYIHEELNAWRPQDATFVVSVVDNAIPIHLNLQFLLNDSADLETTVTALHDALGYHMKRAWYNPAGLLTWRSEARWISAKLDVLAPNHRLAVQARLADARTIQDDDPAGALAIIQEVLHFAVATDDEPLRQDALFRQASLYVATEQYTVARGVFSRLLRRPLSPMFEGQVRIALAGTYQASGQIDQARRLLADIAADDAYDDHVRASALLLEGSCWELLGRRDLAIQCAYEVIEYYPQTGSAATANKLLDTLGE